MNATTQQLVSEMNTLRAAVRAHKEQIDNACEARDLAIEAAGIPVVHGRYALDFKNDAWRFPSVAAALDILEALSEDSGYFWACSRLSDLERLFGLGIYSGQLPLRAGTIVPLVCGGEVPEAHPCVRDFLAVAA